jgi:hypothetical protein
MSTASISTRAASRSPTVRGRVVARAARRPSVTPRAGRNDDTLSALDRLVPGVSAEEAARTPPPPRDADPDADDEVFATLGGVVREVTVELDPPENIAVAKIPVDSASTRVVQATMSPPLGIVFEESSDGNIVVTEVLPEGNAARVGGVTTGDVLRACSAMIPEMKYGQGNLLLGGNGRPGFRRVLFMVPRGEEYREVLSFDQTMGAVMSNAKAGDFDVTVVLERRSRG